MFKITETIVTTSVTEEIRFEWNVAGSVLASMSFPYNVGEGPLYWYRIDWYPKLCSDQTPAPLSPTISYIEPTCPYEIIENCIILPPDCPCDPPCTPGPCISREIEVWHMMATSVRHLCERINQECCHRKPPGVMRRVQQYMRPTLCCDVPYPAGSIDNYVDVNFILCECGNLVDPCIQRFVYPEHINKCGIHGPAYTNPDPNPLAFTDNIFGTPINMFKSVDTTGKEITLVPPVKEVVIDKIVNRFGPFISEKLYCNHNLKDLPIFKDFLKRNNKIFEFSELFYDSNYNSWQSSTSFFGPDEQWRFNIAWSLNDETEKSSSGFKFDLNIERKARNLVSKSKVLLNVKLDTYPKEKFALNFDFDTRLQILSDMQLQFKLFNDKIGVFKDNFVLKINIEE